MFGCSRSAVNQDIYLTLNPEHPSYPKRRLKLEILERDGRTCQYCGCLLIGSLESSVMEHVIPESQGGPLESYNLVAACFRCHEQDGRGANIGPDLTTLRGTLTKERLLESLLTPSKEIAPRYTPWLIEMKDGRVLTGLYVDEEVDGTLQLADPAGKIVRIHPREIEVKKPSLKSIMPEGLLNQLTAQEARDLFAFLLQKPETKP